jgi:hypothetical protein
MLKLGTLVVQNKYQNHIIEYRKTVGIIVEIVEIVEIKNNEPDPLYSIHWFGDHSGWRALWDRVELEEVLLER